MILFYIITSILYLIMIIYVLLLYYTYRKDIEELENRFIIVEKRLGELEKTNESKEGDNTMACKGKRKK